MGKELKGFLILGLIAFVLIVIYHCEQGSNEEAQKAQAAQSQIIQKTFGEERVLRKVKNSTNFSSWFSASSNYFLFAGSSSVRGEKKSFTEMAFSWLTNEGIYAISTMPITKVRFNPNPNAEKRTVKFVWRDNFRRSVRDLEHMKNMELQTLITSVMDHVIITCKESDWPAGYDFSLN